MYECVVLGRLEKYMASLRLLLRVLDCTICILVTPDNLTQLLLLLIQPHAPQ